MNVVFGSDVPDSVGGPDLDDRVELRDEIEASESEPAPAPETGGTVEAEAAPVATGDGCTSDGRIVAPVNGTVTGSYGENRGDHAHSGTDIAAPTGTTVRAAECGTVSVSGEESGYGQMICVRHAGETTTCYAHLSERDVAVNEYVKAGQKIGEVGCTGSCTGPHVHFEVRQNGAAEDPSPYLQGSRTVSGASAEATSAPMPEGEGGTGGATPEQQAEVFGGTGGAEAPAATTEATATTAVPVDEVAPAAPPAEAAPAPRRGSAGRGRAGTGRRGTRAGRRSARSGTRCGGACPCTGRRGTRARAGRRSARTGTGRRAGTGREAPCTGRRGTRARAGRRSARSGTGRRGSGTGRRGTGAGRRGRGRGRRARRRGARAGRRCVSRRHRRRRGAVGSGGRTVLVRRWGAAHESIQVRRQSKGLGLPAYRRCEEVQRRHAGNIRGDWGAGSEAFPRGEGRQLPGPRELRSR